MFLDGFTGCLLGLGVEPTRIAVAAAELDRRYREEHRHYHTFAHLEHVYVQLSPVLDQLRDRDAVILALAYHDAVYEVTRSDNEERSADLARITLVSFGIDRTFIDRVVNLILSTKTHGPGADPDTDLFTDADLSILGSAPEEYARYASQVRREYGIYPDFLYRRGRRKVLEHFLAMDRVFRTAWFHERYGVRAQLNLQAELERL